MSDVLPDTSPEQRSLVGRVLGFFLGNRLIALLMVIAIVGAGVWVAPFDWEIGDLERSPVPTDAIPDIGENQQIVFTEWMGRSPQDVEDQITYPLTVALLGVPGVRTVRSYSYFGFSTVYLIFEEAIDFHWSRSRILEKLASLPADALPPGVRPALGPDATALGQIFWYTLEGRDPDGRPVGGWDLEELRTVQDWHVRYGLASAGGVAEVASVGGFVREYQADVDPDAMRAYGVSLDEVFRAVAASNIDVGARTIEVNRVEYFIRSIGFLKRIDDIENSVVTVRNNVPVLVRHVATVTAGPALRRGALDKDGAEAVGGVVVARYGADPLEVIGNVKAEIAKIAPGLPAKAVIDFTKTTPQEVRRFAERHGFEAYAGAALNHAAWVRWLRETRERRRDLWPPWVTLSQVTVVPFYDRTGLIYETLGTLSDALAQEILITAIVVVLMVLHLRSSVLVGGMLPLAVLLCFVAMRLFGVDANIVALSGIAIAIGTIVDMGIVICENILRHMGEAMDVLSKQDMALAAVPEIERVVGKIGRVDSPLDPAPVSMVETVINYRPEYVTDRDGRRVTFRYDDASDAFVRDADGELIPDPGGRPFRQWRDHIRTPDDIWNEIVRVTEIPGTTSAPKLQPIATRLVMLQTGMRAPMGVKVQGWFWGHETYLRGRLGFGPGGRLRRVRRNRDSSRAMNAGFPRGRPVRRWRRSRSTSSASSSAARNRRQSLTCATSGPPGFTNASPRPDT